MRRIFADLQSIVVIVTVFLWTGVERLHTALFLLDLRMRTLAGHVWSIVSSPTGNTFLLLLLVLLAALPAVRGYFRRPDLPVSPAGSESSTRRRAARRARRLSRRATTSPVPRARPRVRRRRN